MNPKRPLFAFFQTRKEFPPKSETGSGVGVQDLAIFPACVITRMGYNI